MINYRSDVRLSVKQFCELLEHTTLGARRPLDKPDLIEGMLKNASLTVTAWEGESLVGVARSVTDFAYCCYLSDLAVHEAYQRQGIGRGLIAHTALALPESAKIILLAAPQAVDYYPKLGFERHPQAYTMTVSQAAALAAEVG
ncbi:MAG: GNAT family N-acetyltransferase [Succinivibrio sp.]|nr:GNAT family N-acetyltransferase [Succinivibrio sp.]